MSQTSNITFYCGMALVCLAILCALIKIYRLLRNPKLRKDAPVTELELEFNEKLEKAKIKSLVSYKEEQELRKAQARKKQNYCALDDGEIPVGETNRMVGGGVNKLMETCDNIASAKGQQKDSNCIITADLLKNDDIVNLNEISVEEPKSKKVIEEVQAKNSSDNSDQGQPPATTTTKLKSEEVLDVDSDDEDDKEVEPNIITAN